VALATAVEVRIGGVAAAGVFHLRIGI
jgi:hypothetical protein